MITRDELSKKQKQQLESVQEILENGIKKLEGKAFTPDIVQLALEEYEFERGSTGYTGQWYEEILSNSYGYVVKMEVKSPLRETFELIIENDQGKFNVKSVDMVV
ncbi:MAG: hypothetical protein ACOCRO_08445 [Halanaerobiales bacterium]